MNRSNLITMTGIDENSTVSSYYSHGIPHRLDTLNVSNNKDYEHYHHPVATKCCEDELETILPLNLARPHLADPYSSNSINITPAASPPPSSDSMVSPPDLSSGFLEGFPQISFREVNKDEISTFRRVMAIRKQEEMLCYQDEGSQQVKPNHLPVVALPPEAFTFSTRNEPQKAINLRRETEDSKKIPDSSKAEQESAQPGSDDRKSSLFPSLDDVVVSNGRQQRQDKISIGQPKCFNKTREITVKAPRGEQLTNVRLPMSATAYDHHGHDGQDDSHASLYPLGGKSERILPEDFIPGEWSIVIGKDKKSLESSGNQRLRFIVRLFLHKYATCGLYQRNYKSAVISEIISTMLNGHGHDRPGVIIRYKNGRWYEVGIGFAREKISRMLREFLHTQYKSSSKQKRQKLRRRSREEE